jgi:hypothetical protein
VKIRVHDTIDRLAADLAEIPVKAIVEMTEVVRKNTNEGTKEAQAIARAASGPHGSNYYKRISGELKGPLTGEYGPTGVVDANAVGAGYRNRPPNTDLEKSLDLIGPKFSHDVAQLPDRWFW